MKNPFSFLRRKSAAPNRGSSLFHAIRARFAAATSAAPERGVSYAEALVDDNAANPETRRRLRVLSRYEFRHNAYARGTDHETDHALITSISCTDHMTAHALITWMIIH